MSGCDRIRTELGAYALGALHAADAARVERHLPDCPGCREELDQLAFASELLRGPVARWLALESDETPAAADALAAVAAARAGERRRRRALTAATLTSAGGLLLAIGIAVSLALRPIDAFAPGGPAATLRPAPGVAAMAAVRLSARPWGTQVDLAASGMPALPPGSYYEVWLVRADGTRVAAGTFRPTAPNGRARVRLAAALPLAAVVRIGVTREGAGGSRNVLAGTPPRI